MNTVPDTTLATAPDIRSDIPSDIIPAIIPDIIPVISPDPAMAPQSGPSSGASIGQIEPDQEIDFERRFGGIARLYGVAALARFRAAHLCVIGVGGVGSWIVEALARSAIGQLTLIDLDNVAESNINRQIQALTSTIGQPKISALAGRIGQINPYCRVNQIEDFITPDNLDAMIGKGQYDFVIDAIDDVRAKTALIAYCREHQVRLLTIGSAGGQRDPTQIAIRDLAKTEQEPLLAKVRKRLRAYHRFPRGDKVKFGIEAVFSMEAVRFPESCDPLLGSADSGLTGLNCAGFGSAMVVTAGFGLAAAGRILQVLADEAGQNPSGRVATSARPVPDIASHRHR